MGTIVFTICTNPCALPLEQKGIDLPPQIWRVPVYRCLAAATRARWRPVLAFGLLSTLGLLLPTATRLTADPPKDGHAKKSAEGLPSGVITAEMWKQVATTPLEKGEID